MEKKITIMEGPYTITYNINRYHFNNDEQRDLVKGKIHARDSKAYGEKIKKWEIEQEKYMCQAMRDDAAMDIKLDRVYSIMETEKELKAEGYDIQLTSFESLIGIAN